MSAFKRGDPVELTERGRRIIDDRRVGRWKPAYAGVVTTARQGSDYISVRRLGHRGSESWWRGFWRRRPTVTPTEKAEGRIKELEEAFSRVSDEGDALSAEKEGYEHDLVVAAEEHAKTLAELDGQRVRHEADHKSVVDLMDDLTRAREEAGALRKMLADFADEVERNTYGPLRPEFQAGFPNIRRAVADVRTLLSGSTSTEISPAWGNCSAPGRPHTQSHYHREDLDGERIVWTSPAREGTDCSAPGCPYATPHYHRDALAIQALVVWPAPENAPQEERP